MEADPTTVQAVKTVLVSTLGLEDQAGRIDANTALLDSLPELDSLAIVSLAAALEDRFQITIADEEMTGEVFETLGTLSGMVHGHLAGQESSA